MGRFHFSSTLIKVLICIVILSALSHPAWTQLPALATQVPGVASVGNTLFVLLPIVNAGTGPASAVQITSITLGQLRPTTPSSLPLSLGDMAGGAISLVNLAFTDTTLIIGNKYLLTVRGTYVAGGTTLGFSVNRFINFGVPTIFQLPANPLNVNPTADPTHAVTQFISALDGGTITGTGADGTVFTLTLPPNALLGDEVITMTPLTGVSGLPISGGFVAGVELTPDELALSQPANLTIQPATSIPIGEQVGFSYHGGGQEFFFYPLDLVTTVSFTIQQLNAYGLANGNVTQVPVPTDSFDRLENEIEQITAPKRATLQPALQLRMTPETTSASNSQFAAQESDFLQNAYEQVIQPELQQALGPNGTFDSENKAAIDALKWARTVALLGFDQEPTFQTEFKQAQQEALISLPLKEFNAAFALCFSQPGPQSVARLVRAVRQIALASGDPATVLGADYQEKIDKCANVTLMFDFDSHIKATFTGFPPGGLASTDSVVQATGLMLKWKGGAFEMDGATLNYLSFAYTDGTYRGVIFCTKLVSNAPGTLSVKAEPSINRFGELPPPFKQPPFSMLVKIFDVNTFETFLTGIIDLNTGGCVQAPPSLRAPWYQADFFAVGGTNEFEIPLNSVKSFMRSITFSTPPTSGRFNEVNTTVTLNGPSQ
jgi:hypothetical protein